MTQKLIGAVVHKHLGIGQEGERKQEHFNSKSSRCLKFDAET